MSEEITFKTVDDIIEYYRWGSYARKRGEEEDVDAELPPEVPSSHEGRKGKRNPAYDEADLPGSSDCR